MNLKKGREKTQKQGKFMLVLGPLKCIKIRPLFESRLDTADPEIVGGSQFYLGQMMQYQDLY